MVKGRKPRAVEVNEASGRYKKDPQLRPKNTIKAATGEPVPPDLVAKDPIAIKVWRETVEILAESGILSRSDAHLLTQYVITYSEWCKAAAHVLEHGHDNGSGRASAESVAFFKLSTDHQKLLAELGLSPSSRARLSVATSDPNDAKENRDLRAYLRAVKDGKK